MPFHEGFTDEERLVVLHFLSRSWSPKGVLRLLKVKLAKNHSDLEVEQMITGYNVKREEQGATLLYDTQRLGQEWDLGAVDGIIDELKHQLPTGRADELMSIRLEDETMVLNKEPERENIARNLHDMRRGPAREPYPAMHSPNPAGVPTIATGFAASPNPTIPVILAPTNPTIAAFSLFAPGQPDGLPDTTQDSALLNTMSSGPRGTLYERNPPRGGPQLTYSGQIPPPGEPGTSDSGIGNGGGSGGEKGSGGNMSRCQESRTGGKNDSGSSGDGNDRKRPGLRRW